MTKKWLLITGVEGTGLLIPVDRLEVNSGVV